MSNVVACLFSRVHDKHDQESLSLVERVACMNYADSMYTIARSYFADGELCITLPDHTMLSGSTVLIMHSMSAPVQDNVLSVAFAVHEAKNAGAARVIACVPYFGYGRQECSAVDGKPGNVAVVIKLLEGAGVDELITVALHDPCITKLFSIPVHNISLMSIIAEHIVTTIGLEDMCLVSPDAGGLARVQAIARLLDVECISFEKERFAVNQSRIVGSSGTYRGKRAIIIDDIIDTGGTAINAAEQLALMGFDEIYGYFVHPVLSGDAVKKLEASNFTKIFVSNTLALSSDKYSEKIIVFDGSAAVASVLKDYE